MQFKEKKENVFSIEIDDPFFFINIKLHPYFCKT